MAPHRIKDPSVAAKLSKLDKVEDVEHELTSYLQDGFRIDPGEYMVKNQIKLAVLSSDGFERMPKLFKMGFQIGPERGDLVNIADYNIKRTVDNIADAFNVDQKTRIRWADAILTENDPHVRAGLLTKMWDEFAARDPAIYERAVTRQAKYASKSTTRWDRSCVSTRPTRRSWTSWAAIEISVKDTEQLLAMGPRQDVRPATVGGFGAVGSHASAAEGLSQAAPTSPSA
jgi:phytoene dehydrogenase-like protein